MVNITDTRQPQKSITASEIPSGQYFTASILGWGFRLWVRSNSLFIAMDNPGVQLDVSNSCISNYSPVDLDITIKEAKA